VRASYKHLLAQLQSHFLEIGKCNEWPTVNVDFRLDEVLPVHAIAREQVRRNFAMSPQTFADIAKNAPDQLEFIRGLDYIIPA
jgi:hypothetical protein